MAAVVVCYNSEAWLARLVDSFVQQSARECLKAVYLIDNGRMSEEVVSRLTCRDSRVRYYRCSRNLNFGGGNNIGIRLVNRGSADFVLIANPDTWFEAGAIERLVVEARRNPTFGVLSGLQLEYDSNKLSKWAERHVRLKDACAGAEAGVIETAWVEGSCMLVTRRCLEVVGGFEPLYEMYFEDVDLCRRARLAGFRVGVVPAAKYHHHSNASYGDLNNPERVARIDRSRFRYLLMDPKHSWRRNQLRSLYWFLARLGRWCLGRRPGFRGAILPIVSDCTVNLASLRANFRERHGGNLRVRLHDDPEALLARPAEQQQA